MNEKRFVISNQKMIVLIYKHLSSFSLCSIFMDMLSKILINHTGVVGSKSQFYWIYRNAYWNNFQKCYFIFYITFNNMIIIRICNIISYTRTKNDSHLKHVLFNTGVQTLPHTVNLNILIRCCWKIRWNVHHNRNRNNNNKKMV